MRSVFILCRCLPLLLGAGLLSAQAPAPAADSIPGGSISGQVVLATGKTPVSDATVRARSGTKTSEAKADAQGRYTLKDVAPGAVTVIASRPPGQIGPPVTASRRIQLGPAQDLVAIDLQMPTPPQITGRVIDENKEPVPGVSVMLVAREYSHGALRYVFSSAAQTDDQGNYTMGRVDTGRAYLLLARRIQPNAGAISNLPTDPAMRKRADASTFYPGTTEVEAAQPIMLRDGEVRQGVDIPLLRGPSLCIEGQVLAGTSPGPLRFDIGPERPTYGTSGNGGMYGQSPFGGKAGDDGVIRTCGLTPGTYTVSVNQVGGSQDPPAFYGTGQVTLKDKDLQGVAISGKARVPVPVEVALDGPQSQPAVGTDPPPRPKINVSFQSIVRSQFSGEKRGGQIELPGTLFLDGVYVDDYFVQVFGLPAGTYTKDVTYDGASVMRGVAQVGKAAANASLKVIVGQDGGFIQTKVADKDGNPVGDSSVTIFPADAISEADIAVTYVTGQTDQTGAWKSPALAPGKYYVLAAKTPPDRSPEAVAKLLAARSRMDTVGLAPGATLSVPVVERSLE